MRLKLLLGTISLTSTDRLRYREQKVSSGKCFTLRDALTFLLPGFFAQKLLTDDETSRKHEDEFERIQNLEEVEEASCDREEASFGPSDKAELKLVRIQGIEPKLEIPFSWVVNNLMNPEHFLHICVYIRVPQPNTT